MSSHCFWQPTWKPPSARDALEEAGLKGFPQRLQQRLGCGFWRAQSGSRADAGADRSGWQGSPSPQKVGGPSLEAQPRPQLPDHMALLILRRICLGEQVEQNLPSLKLLKTFPAFGPVFFILCSMQHQSLARGQGGEGGAWLRLKGGRPLVTCCVQYIQWPLSNRHQFEPLLEAIQCGVGLTLLLF